MQLNVQHYLRAQNVHRVFYLNLLHDSATKVFNDRFDQCEGLRLRFLRLFHTCGNTTANNNNENEGKQTHSHLNRFCIPIDATMVYPYAMVLYRLTEDISFVALGRMSLPWHALLF